MRHQLAGRKLGRTSGHRRALYRNLVTDLLKREKSERVREGAESALRELASPRHQR